MEEKISKLQEGELRAMIAIAEACCRPDNPSYSWHVLDWICFKMRCKYPLVMRRDSLLHMGPMT